MLLYRKFILLVFALFIGSVANSKACCTPVEAGTISPLKTRKQIRVVGSSSAYPFTATVAERFAFQHDALTPVVESIGTGGGIKVFCNGVGKSFPDIVMGSRRMTEKETELCRSRNVKGIYEIILGIDGIVLVHSTNMPCFSLTREQIFLALAEKVPVGGKLIRNPYQFWNDIDPSLPKTPIVIFGPPPTSGTHESFHHLVMSVGCKAVKHNYPDALPCSRVRKDGTYIEIGANENMIIQKVVSSPGAVGIVSYSFMDQNRDRVRAIAVENILPTYDSIRKDMYPISRPLYIYVKKDHEAFVPDLHNFAMEFTAKAVSGINGYLTRRGLIPLPEELRKKQRKDLKEHKEHIQLASDSDGHH